MSLNPLAEDFFKNLFSTIGEDPQREGLQKTPQRVLNSFYELTSGYHIKTEDFFKNALFECEYDEMVWIKEIPFYSLCEHHLLPFFGHCTVAYLPKGHVLGLSKINKVVDMYARRLQLQERLSSQIAETVKELGKTDDVGVFIQAKHLCIAMRGARKESSETITYSTLGRFKTEEIIRKEFFRGARDNTSQVFPLSSLKLKTINIPVSLGCWPEEKKAKTNVAVDLTLKYEELPKACYTDCLADTICYDKLAKDIVSFCAHKHFDLIEHLGYEMYRFVKAQLLTSVQIKLCLCKPLKESDVKQSRFIVGDF